MPIRDRAAIFSPFAALSGHGAALAETARVTRFEFAPGDITLHLPAACALHVFAGTPEEIVAGYMRLSGQAVLPPKWALGPWISANHWDSREKLENAVAEAQERGFPVTVAVVEAWSDEATFYIFRGAKYEPRPAGAALRLDDFDFSASPWPQPGEMIENLHGRGVHLVLWQIPVYKQLEPHEPANRQLELDWADAVERGLCVTAEGGAPYKIPQGHWFAGSLVPDFTNPQTVESWFGKRAYLNELGVDGFKTDGGEFILSAGARFADGTAGDEGRNLYPQMYTGAYTENLAPGQALFSRVGYVGAHTTPMLWAGDQLSSFDELRSVLNAGLSASASGVVFWGFDIGGFAGELPTPELYMRATQLACFVPVMQWHSEPDGGQFRLLQPGMEGNNERSPWNIERAFGLSGYADSLRYWHCLRMELLPYIYAEALKCTRGSRPLMRMLPYAWRQPRGILQRRVHVWRRAPGGAGALGREGEPQGVSSRRRVVRLLYRRAPGGRYRCGARKRGRHTRIRAFGAGRSPQPLRGRGAGQAQLQPG